MLVGANDGAVDMMQAPVELPLGICLLLEVGQDAVPNAGPSPAIEAGGDCLPRPVLLGQIAPGSTGPIEPQQAIEDGTVILGRAATSCLLWWKQRPQPLPLLVGQISSAHTSESTHFDNF